MYNVLSPMFFNSDPRIVEVANAHVMAIGEACADLIESGAVPQAIGDAMRKAAIATIPDDASDPVVASLSVENDGIAMLHSLCPIEFEPGFRIVSISEDAYGRVEIREEKFIDNEWRVRRYMDKEKQILMGAVILKLFEEIPAVKERFLDCTGDKRPIFKQRLQNAAIGVTDRGWTLMADWALYCLDIPRPS